MLELSLEQISTQGPQFPTQSLPQPKSVFSYRHLKKIFLSSSITATATTTTPTPLNRLRTLNWGHNTIQMSKFSASESKTPMDSTHKKHPKSAHFTARTTKPQHHHQQHHHPLPDPITAAPSSIQSISNHFSKLYANHKNLASLKPSGRHSQSNIRPQADTNIQAKSLAVSSVLDISCATLTKSNSQHQRNDVAVAHTVKKELGTRTKVKDKNSKEEIKKSSRKESKKSFEEYDVKKAANLMSRSADGEQIKKLQKRFEITRQVVPVNGGRRRSFCNSQAELADFLSCTGVKVVSVDMPPFMQIHAVDCARKTHDSLEKFTSKTLALTLKKEFDGVYGPAWHCIVGTSFGSFVTHSVGGFMYFSMDNKLHVLLFKTTVHKAY